MRWIWLGLPILVLALWAIGCPPHIRRAKPGEGVEALLYWRSVQFRGDETVQQIRALKSQLQAKVEQYITERPTLTEAKRAQLRKLIVSRGMTREEARFLLGEPPRILRKTEDLQKRAGPFWPELRERTQEAWIYHSDTLFFSGEEIIDILYQVDAVL